MNKSLSLRLLLLIAVPITAALLIAGVICSISAHREVQEIYDAQLSHVAKLVYGLVQSEMESHPGAAPINAETYSHAIKQQGHKYEEKTGFRIWQNDTLLFATRCIAKGNFGPIPDGYSNQVSAKGDGWRFFALAIPDKGFRIEVGQKIALRAGLQHDIVLSIFWPFALMMPCIILLAWFGVRKGLKTLEVISGAVEQRTPYDTQRLSFDVVPKEVEPLVASINHLLARLGEALQKERRFTDLAAHELRTPIAIIKTQAQIALKSTSAEEKEAILNAQLQAVDRASHMVGQLLSMARLDHTDVPKSDVALDALVQQIFQDLYPSAREKDLRLSVEIPADVTVQANRDLLEVALRNLLDNAIKYCDQAGEVGVQVYANDNATCVTIYDSGPGIDESLIPSLTQRFYRGPAQGKAGIGLGLSIVQRATQLLGGQLNIKNRSFGHGLAVTIGIPAATAKVVQLPPRKRYEAVSLKGLPGLANNLWRACLVGILSKIA